mgnify:CR=1 FL=1
MLGIAASVSAAIVVLIGLFLLKESWPVLRRVGAWRFLLDGAWVKASAAFNLELCNRFGTKPLDFDGYEDALLHSYDLAGNRHMEYVRMRGTYYDFPFDEMMAAFAEE